MTPAEFDMRAFWTLTEVLDLIATGGRNGRRRYREWLHSGEVTSVSASGVTIVTRSRLEANMPEILETMRRAVRSRAGTLR